MSKKKRENTEGMYPEAHPTAPGGMSQTALVAELVAKHGWTEIEAEELNWPEKIDAVSTERRNRELERDAEETKAPEPAALLILNPNNYDFIFDGHSGAGPSGSSRWMNCTASLAASRAFLQTLTPNQQAGFAVSSTAAQQGTTAHAVAEVKANVMLGRMDEDEADFRLMELSFLADSDEVAYDDDMEEFVQEYVDLVKMYADEGHEILIEQRVSAAVWLDDDTVHEITGSVDFGAKPIRKDNWLVVGDLKYGVGVSVDVEENSQARIYALGLLAELADDEGNLPDLDGVRYYIAQPRLGGISQWEESVDDLLDWRDDVLAPALALALAGPEGGATYTPADEACHVCPARGSCPALIEQTIDKAADLFDAMFDADANGDGKIPVGTLSDERLGDLLKQVQDLVKIEKDMKEEAQRRLFRGNQITGYQLVNYQPPRSWDEKAAETFEGNEVMWTKKMLSPTQAEKVVKDNPDLKEMVDQLTIKPDVRPVVAKVGDRRKTWSGVPPEQMFPETN